MSSTRTSYHSSVMPNVSPLRKILLGRKITLEVGKTLSRKVVNMCKKTVKRKKMKTSREGKSKGDSLYNHLLTQDLQIKYAPSKMKLLA